MRGLRRLLAPVAVLGVLLAACTGDGGQAGSSSRPPSTATTPSSVASTSVAPGTGVYVYENAGLVATLHLEAGSGTLEIDNRTGRELAPPDFYLLDARDGRRVEGTVDGPEPTPDGTTNVFDVSFSGLEVRNVGLAVLLIGRDNFGAFVRE